MTAFFIFTGSRVNRLLLQVCRMFLTDKRPGVQLANEQRKQSDQNNSYINKNCFSYRRGSKYEYNVLPSFFNGNRHKCFKACEMVHWTSVYKGLPVRVVVLKKCDESVLVIIYGRVKISGTKCANFY